MPLHIFRDQLSHGHDIDEPKQLSTIQVKEAWHGKLMYNSFHKTSKPTSMAFGKIAQPKTEFHPSYQIAKTETMLISEANQIHLCFSEF